MSSELGNAVTSTNATFAAGVFGNAIKREQTQATDKIVFDNPALMSQGTVEMWVKADATVFDSQHMFNVGDAPSGWLWCYLQNYSGAWRFVFMRAGSATDPAIRSGEFPVGVWVHVAFVWDFAGVNGSGDLSRVYQDGVLCTGYTVDQAQSIMDPIATMPFKVAEAWDENRFWDGPIDNIKIWDYAKTDFSDRFVEAFGTSYAAQKLIVGGGGGGSSGGGGAGGVNPDIDLKLEPGKSYSIFVGDGGPGQTVNVAPGGTNGQDSIFAGYVIGKGGGFGSAIGDVTGGIGAGGTGGSGGGGGAYSGGTTTVGLPFYNQGFRGGNNQGYTAPPYPSAGGGGAGNHSVDNVSSAQGGGGGPGVNTFSTWFADILAGGGPALGVSGYIAGGGGGTVYTGAGSAGAGQHGGGNGTTSGDGQAGTANTGGGGGATASGWTGGKGGSGLIIIRYAGAVRGTGGDYTVTYGGYTYHIWTTIGSSSFTA